MNVEKLVSAVADDLLVNRVYNGIILRTANALHSVSLVKTLASCFLRVTGIGLSAAVYTAAGTSHNLDEVEMLACGCTEENSLCISKTADNSNVQLTVTVRQVEFRFVIIRSKANGSA